MGKNNKEKDESSDGNMFNSMSTIDATKAEFDEIMCNSNSIFSDQKQEELKILTMLSGKNELNLQDPVIQN